MCFFLNLDQIVAEGFFFLAYFDLGCHCDIYDKKLANLLVVFYGEEGILIAFSY